MNSDSDTSYDFGSSLDEDETLIEMPKPTIQGQIQREEDISKSSRSSRRSEDGDDDDDEILISPSDFALESEEEEKEETPEFISESEEEEKEETPEFISESEEEDEEETPESISESEEEEEEEETPESISESEEEEEEEEEMPSPKTVSKSSSQSPTPTPSLTKQETKKIIDFSQMNIENIQDYLQELGNETNLENPQYNTFLLEKEKLEIEAFKSYDFEGLKHLYPSMFDTDFNMKIALKKEFNDFKYDEEIKDVFEESERLCNAEFELAPHQAFVRNFLSSLTPYNSLLLYHGLGVGKTCSGISVAEEYRDYMKQVGLTKKIIIVASPNVQQNFKTQLFDERRLKQANGLFTLRACTGNKLINEVNPTNIKGLSKEDLSKQINKIIREYYTFMGYIEFSNYISKIKELYTDKDKSIERKKKIRAIKNEFSNRLIIFDEVHNIRSVEKNKNRDVEENFLDIVRYTDNLKLLFLSATPMFNNYKEIVWLLNLMNMNDKKPQINVNDIFDKDGNLLKVNGKEIGKELLIQKSRGYVSFVRGENPYSFPYRIYPSMFEPENTVFYDKFTYPNKQINDAQIIQPMELVDIYLTELGSYQKEGYEFLIRNFQDALKTSITKSKIQKGGQDDEEFKSIEETPERKNGDEDQEYIPPEEQDTSKVIDTRSVGLGWLQLEPTIQGLNIVYPSKLLDEYIETKTNPSGLTSRDIIGENGLSSVVTYSKVKMNDFAYGQRVLDTYGRIFSQEELPKYSHKISSIIEHIRNSKGIVLIYSQYIEGGCVPIALALEEMGISRYGRKNLFEKQYTEQIDAITMKPKGNGEKTFQPAKYIMITGNKNLSPKNKEEIKMATNDDNVNGEKVKVIIISRAGSEGIDFKFIRQVHIMEPWFNMSRLEQIIGRAVRFCSHTALPFNKRNVEIYLYATKPYNDYEPTDMYVYRNAEMKALQVGNVSRVLKENAVDCILNEKFNELTEENMNQEVSLELSSGYTIQYKIGDKPYTQVCDYLEKCQYICYGRKPFPKKEDGEDDIDTSTYDEQFIVFNVDRIIQKIKDLFKIKHVYTKRDLIMELTIQKKYPMIQINMALETLVKQENEFIVDMYGRLGHMINIGEYYMFQPIELNNNPNISRYERSNPIEYKRERIGIELPDQVNKYILSLDEYMKTQEAQTITKTQEVVPEIEEKEESETEEEEEEKESETEEEEEIKPKPSVRKMVRKTIPVPKQILREKIEQQRDEKVEKILTMLEDNYNLALATNTMSKGDTNWYKHASFTIQRLVKDGNIPEKTLQSYVVYHAFETLKFETKKTLIEHIFTKDERSYTDLEKTIYEYIQSTILISTSKIKAFLLKDTAKDKPTFYVLNKDTILEEAKPLDLEDIKKSSEIKKVVKPLDSIHTIVGFMGYFDKTNEIVFKTKQMDMKRNKGARCDQAGKANIIKLLNQLYKDVDDRKLIPTQKEYTSQNTKDILAPQLCCEEEFLMRYLEDKNYKKKVWFISYEIASLNNIENVSRAKK